MAFTTQVTSSLSKSSLSKLSWQQQNVCQTTREARHQEMSNDNMPSHKGQVHKGHCAAFFFEQSY